MNPVGYQFLLHISYQLTDRKLPKRRSEYIPTWLVHSMSQHTTDGYSDRESGSLIAKHPITTNQAADPILPLHPLVHEIDRQILALNEVMLIRLHNLVLFTQKLLTQTLFSPWRWHQ